MSSWARSFQFLGDNSHRNVAGPCPRFKKIYQEVFDTCTTAAEEMVQTFSGAELFCNEANSNAKFRIGCKDILIIYWDQGRSALEFVRDVAAKNGRLEVVQWAVAQGCSLNDKHTAICAAYGGNMLLLEWIIENGCPWNPIVCAGAALKGHLTMLKWLRKNNCPWNAETFTAAAYNGHLTVLQWARANGWLWY